jgi:predicted TIM-barrel fold metal-dependent hydrolase
MKIQIDTSEPMCDAHVHFGTCSLSGLTFMEKDVVQLVKRFNLRKLFLFPFDVDSYAANKAILNLSRSVRQTVPLIRISLADKRSVNLLEESLREEMAYGVKIHPSLDRTPITASYYRPVFDIVDQYGKIAVVHCGRWKEVSSYKFAIQIAKEFSNARIILTHMGGDELACMKGAIQAARGLKNVYIETSNCRISEMIKRAVQELGESRILFGSDTPWGNIPSNACMIQESEISAQAKNQILSSNLIKLLEEL